MASISAVRSAVVVGADVVVVAVVVSETAIAVVAGWEVSGAVAGVAWVVVQAPSRRAEATIDRTTGFRIVVPTLREGCCASRGMARKVFPDRR
jgi:hypothetical protein